MTSKKTEVQTQAKNPKRHQWRDLTDDTGKTLDEMDPTINWFSSRHWFFGGDITEPEILMGETVALDLYDTPGCPTHWMPIEIPEPPKE